MTKKFRWLLAIGEVCTLVMAFQLLSILYIYIAMSNVFNDYFQLNSAVHVYGTRSLDKLHLHTDQFVVWFKMYKI